MITERTLRQWRRDALTGRMNIASADPARPESINETILFIDELNQRILRLTQELLDQHLMRKG
jgi:predicted nucleic acid-binding Zn ribbon protein